MYDGVTGVLPLLIARVFDRAHFFLFGTTNPNRAAFSSHVHRHAGAFFSRACSSHRAGCAIASGASHAGTQCVDRASVVPHEPRDPSIGAEMTQ